MTDWNTAGQTAEESVVTFEGINRDEQDKLEVENFARGVKAPVDDTRGGSAGGGASGGMRIAVRMLALAGAGIGWGIPNAIGAGNYACLWGAVIGVVVGTAGYPIFMAVRSKQASSVKRSTTDTFRLCMTPSQFTVEGKELAKLSFDVRSILRFEGGRDLILHRKEGAVKLPCSLKIRNHAALAATLNDLLTEAKALGGVYRGA